MKSELERSCGKLLATAVLHVYMDYLICKLFFLEENNTLNQISEITCLAGKKKLWSYILFILKNSQQKWHISKPAQSYGMDKCLQWHYHVCQNICMCISLFSKWLKRKICCKLKCLYSLAFWLEFLLRDVYF